MVTAAFLVISSAVAALGWGQVPAFLDEFDGPNLNAEWTPINPASHDGFGEAGDYAIRGPQGRTAGLRRTMGGQGDFITELSLKLETFFLGGAADEAAFARDAGTRDGGQRYWGGEEGDGHVCGRVCGVKAGRDRCYPWWVKSVKISKISLPIFHFPV